MVKLKSLPYFKRPREKLLSRGVEALSSLELVALILGSGVKGKDVFQVSQNLLRFLERPGNKLEVNSLMGITGIGKAKSCQIVAAWEFARRKLTRNLLTIHQPKDILPLIIFIADKKQEHFLCISLNGANEVIANRVVTVGLLNSSPVHPREVFADVILDRAATVILAHNHPSGLLKPSPEDISLTNQMVEAGKILGIPVLDHIIISKKGFFSFKEERLL